MTHPHSTPRAAPDDQLPSDASGETHTEAGALLPCPFCGNADIRPSYVTGAVFCEECGTDGPRSPFWDGDWNTRAERAEAQLAAMTAERNALVAVTIEKIVQWLIRAGMAGDAADDPLAKCLRELTPADATAALDHKCVQAKADGMRVAAGICDADASRREAQAAELAASGGLISDYATTQHARWKAGAVGARLNRDAILAAAQKEAGK